MSHGLSDYKSNIASPTQPVVNQTVALVSDSVVKTNTGAKFGRSIAPITRTLQLIVLFIIACSLKTACSSFWKAPSHEHLAIARTFVSADFQRLVESFQKWPSPCRGRRAHATTDMFLVYAGDLSNDSNLLVQVEELVEFLEPLYAQCIRKVEWISCNIPKEVDIYKPHLQTNLQGWVNGPNRQFEITFRKLQSMGYGKMFLMEADTIPLKQFWLDLLLDEIEVKAPFSLLGR
jgi:hypothetical protein